MPGNSLHFLGQFVALCLLAGRGSDTAFVCCGCHRTELLSFLSSVGEARYCGKGAGIFRNLLSWHLGCQCPGQAQPKLFGLSNGQDTPLGLQRHSDNGSIP